MPDHEDASPSSTILREPMPLTQNEETLQRILHAVEQTERRAWVEVLCAVVLSLATIGSAWCAYQSTLWGGVQLVNLGAMSSAERNAARLTISALQQRAFDASMFIDFVRAKTTGDARTESFLHERFPPEARKAVDAWLLTSPFDNPSAPLHPFLMPEYVQHYQLEAQEQEATAAAKRTAAAQANENSDNYVLLTVVFASVLFFGGIAGTLSSPRIRMSLGIIALVLFTATMVALVTMPICKE